MLFVYCTMANIQKISLSEIVSSVPSPEIIEMWRLHNKIYTAYNL
jgi:hypothetical protein